MIHKQISIFFNKPSNTLNMILRNCEQYCLKNNIQIFHNPTSLKVLQQSQLVITLGGDGLVLQVAKQVYKIQIPIFSVKLGRLGFLSTTTVESMIQYLDLALQGKLPIEKRHMLSITKYNTVNCICDDYIALNDCCIRTMNLRILDIRININQKKLLDYRGDGLIISTATGSTAYSFAATGPILSHRLSSIMLTPICPHPNPIRSMIFSDQDCISFTVNRQKKQKNCVNIDGQITFPMGVDEKIITQISSHRLHLYANQEKNNFSIINKI